MDCTPYLLQFPTHVIHGVGTVGMINPLMLILTLVVCYSRGICLKMELVDRIIDH